jgi:hypothetical protein
MRWEAHTNSKFITIGTTFSILATPQVAEDKPDLLTGGAEIWIVPDIGPRVPAVVVSATPEEAVIEMQDGSRWLMTPVLFGEIGSGITTAGMRSQDWIIRSSAN